MSLRKLTDAMSAMVKPSTPPSSPSRSFPEGKVNLDGVAELIRSGKVKNVVVMAGAGISTSAGIPDFRSPDTGLYHNLEKYDLPFPEAIFDIGYFQRRPEAFYALAKELYPGKYKPTMAHYFFRLLHEKGILKRVFTQNIDTLERLSGLPATAIVEAHGSFATARCIECKTEVSDEWLRSKVAAGEVAKCEVKKCKKGREHGGLVKPDITFFGEGLPRRFFERIGDLAEADLLIVLGTSLKVQPFASLIDRVRPTCPRLLINLELVGEIASYDDFFTAGAHGLMMEEGFDFEGWTCGGKELTRDVFYEGEADAGVLRLAEGCGWKDDLEKLVREGHAELDKRWAAASPPPAILPTPPTVAAKVPASMDEAKVKAKGAAEKVTEVAKADENKGEGGVQVVEAKAATAEAERSKAQKGKADDELDELAIGMGRVGVEEKKDGEKEDKKASL